MMYRMYSRVILLLLISNIMLITVLWFSYYKNFYNQQSGKFSVIVGVVKNSPTQVLDIADRLIYYRDIEVYTDDGGQKLLGRVYFDWLESKFSLIFYSQDIVPMILHRYKLN